MCNHRFGAIKLKVPFAVDILCWHFVFIWLGKSIGVCFGQFVFCFHFLVYSDPIHLLQFHRILLHSMPFISGSDSVACIGNCHWIDVRIVSMHCVCSKVNIIVNRVKQKLNLCGYLFGSKSPTEWNENQMRENEWK